MCKRAVLEGYEVTSLSRRGNVDKEDKNSASLLSIDYRRGDARQKETVANILQEGGYTGIVHCIGLLFDDASGLGRFNVFVSGSGSVPDDNSTYDTITRLTAFHAIEAAIDYATEKQQQQQDDDDDVSSLPFVFTSAAEAGWPDVSLGPQIEQYLAPEWLKRYLAAKRSVEEKLLASSPALRPVIVRPSLIYSLDRPSSYVPVGAFFVGNQVGLPFVDRPVTVQALSCAIVRAIDQETVSGVQRYNEIDELSQ